MASLQGEDYLNQEPQQGAYGTPSNPAQAPTVQGGWGGVLLSGATALAGVATDNPYMVGFGSDMGQSYHDSYDTLNKSLVEEQRANRLAESSLSRQKNLAQWQRDLTQEDRDTAEEQWQQTYQLEEGKLAQQSEQFGQTHELASQAHQLQVDTQADNMALNWAKMNLTEKEVDSRIDIELKKYDLSKDELVMRREEMKQKYADAAQRLALEEKKTDASVTESSARVEQMKADLAQQKITDPLKVQAAKAEIAVGEHDQKMRTDREYAETYLKWQSELTTDLEIDKAKALFTATQGLTDDAFQKEIAALRAREDINPEFINMMEVDHIMGDKVNLMQSMFTAAGKTGTGTSGAGGGTLSKDATAKLEIHYQEQFEAAGDDVSVAAGKARAEVARTEQVLAALQGGAGGKQSLNSLIFKQPAGEAPPQAVTNMRNALISGSETPESLLAKAEGETETAAANAAIAAWKERQPSGYEQSADEMYTAPAALATPDAPGTGALVGVPADPAAAAAASVSGAMQDVTPQTDVGGLTPIEHNKRNSIRNNLRKQGMSDAEIDKFISMKFPQ